MFSVLSGSMSENENCEPNSAYSPILYYSLNFKFESIQFSFPLS
jgi:hypothetical protein